MPINSKAKGSRGEIALCKLFTARFPAHHWSRAVGSGNRWAQVKGMSTSATQTYTGDICTPDNFRWTVEVKCGYDDIYLGSLAPSKALDAMLAQAEGDAARASRKPLLCLKQTRRPWVAFIPDTTFLAGPGPLQHSISYKGWTALPLEDLLQMDDVFWFADTTPTA